MNSTLLEYYERELEYLRRAGSEFATRYPRVAARLQLEATKCDDPHVERILEGFAFLAARVHLKLDDDFSEISEAVLHVVAPHYVRPIPSMTIAEFIQNPDEGKQTAGVTIPRGTELLTAAVRGVPCRFRTGTEVTLWPLTIQNAQWMPIDRLKPAIRPPAGESGAFRIEFRTAPDVSLASLALDRLRLHVTAAGSLMGALYEALANNATRVLVRDPARPSAPPIELPRHALVPAGFDADEALLPFGRRALDGHRLLAEYFAFPEKFHFFELRHLDVLRRAGFTSGFEVVVLTSPFEPGEWRQALESGVNAETFRLGCTPAINLFEVTSDPIDLDQRRTEYVVVPDARRRLEIEVYSVDALNVTTPDSADPHTLQPFYALRHRSGRSKDNLYWLARRRPTPWRKDQSSEVILSFADLDATVTTPGSDIATARLTCYNSDLPSLLPFGDPNGDFVVEGGATRKAVARVRPTSVVQPPMDRGLTWRLVSQLSLNHLSLTDEGGEALRELLTLHDYLRTEQNEQQIGGIRDVRSRPGSTTMRTPHGLAAARGRIVELELDEDRFAGGSMFLFASVIEHFLGMYASLNSYAQTALTSNRRRGVVRQWAPRSGTRPLL